MVGWRFVVGHPRGVRGGTNRRTNLSTQRGTDCGV